MKFELSETELKTKFNSPSVYTLTVRIAIFPSQNGFGHNQRMLSISSSLAKTKENVNVEFYLSPKNYQFFNKSLSKLGFQTLISNHPSKEAEGPWVEFKGKGPTKIPEVDLIICDTITWPISDKIESILFANFLWEDYWDYLKSPKRVSFEKYFSGKSLTFSQSRVFGCEYFSTSSVKQMKNYNSLPIIDYWDFRRKTEPENLNPKMTYVKYLSLGGTGNMLNTLVPLLTTLNLNWMPCKQAIEESIRLKNNLIIIARAGLGTISECISAGIPLISLTDGLDPELNSNSKVVSERGWGISVNINSKDFISEIASALETIEEKYFEYRKRILNQSVISSRELATLIMTGVRK